MGRHAVTTFFAVLVNIIAGLLGPTVSLPPVDATADYQLGGAYTPSSEVGIVTRDSTERPVPGLYNICYVNAFQTQPGALRWWQQKHPQLLLRSAAGKLIRDPGWPDEVLLDIRTTDKRNKVAHIVNAWFDGCARAGFQAVEPDNLDSWTRSRGMLRRADAESFAGRLVAGAHRSGLAIAQKNAAELNGARLGFDFAVAEECEVYRECGAYLKMFGRHVIEIEYTDNGRAAFARACTAQGNDITALLRDRDLVPNDHPDYVFEAC